MLWDTEKVAEILVMVDSESSYVQADLQPFSCLQVSAMTEDKLTRFTPSLSHGDSGLLHGLNTKQWFVNYGENSNPVGASMC